MIAAGAGSVCKPSEADNLTKLAPLFRLCPDFWHMYEQLEKRRDDECRHKVAQSMGDNHS
jgi:hypothetical protein